MNLYTIILLSLPALINLWGIWHAMHNRFETEQERMLWVCLCIFIPVIGGLIYLILGKKRCKKT